MARILHKTQIPVSVRKDGIRKKIAELKAQLPYLPSSAKQKVKGEILVFRNLLLLLSQE